MIAMQCFFLLLNAIMTVFNAALWGWGGILMYISMGSVVLMAWSISSTIITRDLHEYIEYLERISGRNNA